MSKKSPVFKPVADIPKYLYKYVSVKRALEILLTQKIYFANLSEFNDPLEGQFIGGAKSGKESDNTQKRLDEINLGFFSMSEDWDSYPMWAHYANQHRGCCIKFNFRRLQSNYNWEESFPFVFTEKVEYPDKDLEHHDAINHLPHTRGSIHMAKSKSWEYEKEWRAVMYAGDYKNLKSNKTMFKKHILKCAGFKGMKGKNAYPLGKKILDGIILGYNMKDSEKESVFVAARKCKIGIEKVAFRKYKFGMELRAVKEITNL